MSSYKLLVVTLILISLISVCDAIYFPSPHNDVYKFNPVGSSLQNPTHTYTSNGNYTVTLSAYNSNVFNITRKLNFIQSVNSQTIYPSFTYNPNSGSAPLLVTFTDTSTGLPTLSSWAWFFGDETYNQSAYQQTASAAWTSRIAFASVTLKDGSILVMGGRDGSSNYYNDVWRSTDKGISWASQNASTGWNAKSGLSSVVLSDGSIIITGGKDGSFNYYNDTWKSTDNGLTWTQISYGAEYGARYEAGCVILPNNHLVLTGGATGSLFNDVWVSTNNGVNWSLQNTSAGWFPAQGKNTVISSDGSILVLGGIGNHDDVWRSTNEGVTWTQIVASNGITGQAYPTTNLMPDGSLIFIGGTGVYGFLPNVSRSIDNGISWTIVNNSAVWAKRYQHSTVVLPDGSLVITGGFDPINGYLNNVYRMYPTGSALHNPTHIYTAAGNYSVTLTAENAVSYNISHYYTNWVNVSATPLIVDFTSNTTIGSLPLGVQFVDSTTGYPATWNWSFGDGNYSTVQNPTYLYTTAGVYTVSLTVTNINFANSTTKTGYISVESPPIANFSASPLSGYVPLTVAFTDTSTSSPTGWLWDFGDGNTSSDQNPTYQFVQSGNYTVSLIASNMWGSDTKTVSGYINVIGGPTASFTSNVSIGKIPFAVQFNDTSGNLPTSWSWNFGDSGTSLAQNPVHVYTTVGVYTVVLTATNVGGSGIFLQNITAANVPVSNFVATPVDGAAPLLVTFTDLTANIPSSWTWDFGDSNTSTLQNPVHTYLTDGVYTVTLVSTNSFGTNTITKNEYISVEQGSVFITTEPVIVNTTTYCVEFEGQNNYTSPTTVWFEFGMVNPDNLGYKSYKTPNQTGVTGNFSYRVCGIPLLPGQTYKVAAAGDIAGSYTYGANHTFTFPGIQPHVTTTYEQQVDKFVGDGLDPLELLTYDIWQPYLGLMGGLFFGILISFIFMNIAIKQRTIALTIIFLLLAGTTMWRIMPPEFIQIAQMLFIAGLAGMFYWLFMKRR